MRLTAMLPGLLVVAVGGCAAVTDSGSGSSGSPASCRLSPDQDTFRVLVLGDSIAAGYPLSAPDRWSDMLGEGLLDALPGADVEVTNDARSASQVDFLEASVAAHDDLSTYQVAIVIEGVNDVGVIPHPEWERRYRDAIGSIEASGPAVIVGTAPPVLRDGRFDQSRDEVAASLRSIAGDAGRLLLDIERAWRDLGADAAADLYADEIHPSLEGQARIAEMALEIVLSRVRECGAVPTPSRG